MKNIIAFQKGFIVVPKLGIDNRVMAMNVQAELMRFGYMLSAEAFQQLGYADAADIKDFYDEVIDYLKDIMGGKRSYQPIYKGFPQQVMEMSEYDLWINQLVGYYNGGSFTANEWTKTKDTAFEHVKYKMITSGTEQDFNKIFTSLTSVNQSLTPSDFKVIMWFINNHDKLIFPAFVPFKENLCTIFGEAIKIARPLESMTLPILTTTDILRIVVHLSGGDVSLPKVPKAEISERVSRGWRSTYRKVENPERKNFKFKKFKRAERKYILGLLEKSNLDVREMKLKAQRWIRLGEILHPGEYPVEFPRTYNAFKKLRNEKVRSWYGEVETAFQDSFKVGLLKLSERPGELIRRLDFLIRGASSTMVVHIIQILAAVAHKVSNKVLYEVYTHFEKRREPALNRSIMIKGARKKTPLPNLPAINKEIVDTIQGIVFDTFKEKFAKLPALGDCWIDENLKKIPLPTNMRSLNDSLIPLIRGERIPVFDPTNRKTIRCFIHWFDQSGNIDIDLHGYLLGKNKVESFGYNGLRSSSMGCYSGDVRYRKGACAEYVDLKPNEAITQGYNYFLMIAHNFAGESLSDIKECVVGTMERDEPESNDSWLPSTISNSMKVQGASKMCLISVYDLKAGEYIHLDLDFGGFSSYINRGNSDAFFEAIKPYIELPKVSVYDLLQWHVEARGRMVSKEVADTHFLYEDFSGSYTKTLEYMGI